MNVRILFYRGKKPAHRLAVQAFEMCKRCRIHEVLKAGMESPGSSLRYAILSPDIYYSGRMIFHSLDIFTPPAAYLSDCSCNKLNGIYGMRRSKE